MVRDIPPYEGGNPFLTQCDKLINRYILSHRDTYNIRHTISHNLALMRKCPYRTNDESIRYENERNWLERDARLDRICQEVGIDFDNLVLDMIKEGYNPLSPNDIEWWKDNR